jgi:hypothetical protein
MELEVLASSGCEDGDCPTFFVDPGNGDVTVRGYDPADPTVELDVRIPSATWAHLVAQLAR